MSLNLMSLYYTSCCFFWCSLHCLTKTCIIDTKHQGLCSRGPEHSAASSDGAAPESCKANKICGWRSGWIGLEFTNLQCPVSIYMYIYIYIYNYIYLYVMLRDFWEGSLHETRLFMSFPPFTGNVVPWSSCTLQQHGDCNEQIELAKYWV